jgi:hypothetical protein
MKNSNKRIAPAIASGMFLTLLLGFPVTAQPAQSEPADSPAQVEREEQKTTIRTYDKFPDPQGDDQDIEQSTYRKNPDPKGNGQSTDFTRYEEVNKANDGENSPVLTVEEGDVEEEGDE